ncbi:MAG: hypothetical protein PHU54_08490, partial [Candidatus Omnitrophica bacterium]|nr:hypothetical protein [Candidatus Omnitrophota bacterium]
KFADGKLVADHEEIKMIRQLYSDRLDMFKKAGVDLKEMELEADQMWAARRAIKEGGKGSRSLSKKTQEFEREFPTVDVGIAAGTKYEANYRQVIQKTMEDAYSMVAEKQLAEYVKKYAVDLLPDAKNITQKGVAGLLAKLNDAKAISDKTFLAKVSTRLKEAVARNAPDDELQILIKEAIESAESVVDKGALVSFKLRGTEGLKFLADDAKLFSEAINANKAWGGVGGKMLNVAQSITSLTRFTITAFDLGAGWIHGFPLLWNHPKIWGESWGRMLKAMNSKEWMYGYVAANKSAINDAIIRGHMVFESAEYMEGAGLITKIPGVGAVARKFEQAFTGYLDTARIELWKSLSKPNMTDDYARAIGSHIDRLMGSAHYASLGADKNFMALQSVILFAPRYYRSCLGLYKNIATGDIRGYRALQSVARMQANMHLSYYAMCQAMGQEAYLNPADSRYLSFKVGNSYIGLGGFHRSLNRLLVDVGNDISKGNGSGLVETIAEFGRGKLSTLMRLPVDMLTGTNFLGESIFDEGVFMAGVNIGKGQLPIFLQAMLDEAPGDKIGDRVTRMGFEFLGLRSAGFNEYRQLEDARNKLAKQRFNVDYNTLEKKDIKAAREIADDPSIIALQDKVNAQYYGKGAAWWDETRKQYMEYKPAYNDVQEKWKTETFMICEDLRKGIIDIQTFKERVYAQNGIRSTEIDALNAKYPAVANIRYSAKDIPDDASKEYAAYYAYLDQVIGNPKLSDPAMDAAGYSQIKNELDAAYIKEWGDKLYDYVQQARLAGRGQHPIYSNFQLDKDAIAKSGYWDINPMAPDGRTARQQFRVDNPDIDALLFRWGYTSTVQTKDAETMAKNLLKDIGITKTVPEAVNTARMRNISQQAWDYVNKTKSQMNKVSRSVSLNRIADTGYQLNSRINSLEKQIENALSLDKKVELIDTLQGEIVKMNDLNTLLSTQPAEPYLNYFKAQVQAWMADAQIKWGYVSGFK